MITKEQISQIYRQYSAEIYRYLYKLAGNHESAEDILQEVFEKFIIYTADKDIQEDKYRPFLYKTAHNLCVNHLVKQNRAHPGNIDDMEDSLKTEDGHHERMVADDINRTIYALLDSIDPELRSIFLMHKEGGLNYEEIAGSLSISARTVRRKIKHVIDYLYTGLSKDGYIE